MLHRLWRTLGLDDIVLHINSIGDPEERAAHNAALPTDNIETDYYDDQGRPAPWPTK